MYGVGEYKDLIESIDYIYEEYCKHNDRKIFAIGFSLGSNWLGMALGKHKYGLSDKVLASACVQCPMKVD